MSWTSASELRAQLQRLWDKGELLRAAVSESVAWPLRLTLKRPSAADLTDRFEAVRNWVREISGSAHVRIEWREWNHRVQGTQQLPESAWVDTLESALAMIGKSRQAQEFQALWAQTESEQPVLLQWLSRRPLQGLELADRWPRLLAVVAWLKHHPRPGVYLRQVDASGVDSKFIEAHRGVLSELLDLALAPEAINCQASGRTQFAQRYGFLDKPARIRFRLLDAALPSLPGCRGLTDITLDAASFANLSLPVDRVFVTENETNFLAFPALSDAMVLFGAGYGWESLAAAAWLHRCELHYWGDLDTHGFAILDQLRACFPHTSSLLMDSETLLEHRLHWGQEPSPVRHELRGLSSAETAVYDLLRFDRLQAHLRLEQERISYGWLCERLRSLSDKGRASPASS